MTNFIHTTRCRFWKLKCVHKWSGVCAMQHLAIKCGTDSC